jgi:FkbM family methyltransferase
MINSLLIKIGRTLFLKAFFLYSFLYKFFKLYIDRHEISLLNRLIKKGDVVLDIGANIGFYTKIFSKLVGKNGKVICFEPDTLNYSRLKNAIRSNANVIHKNKAIGSYDGKLVLYQSDELNVDHRTYRPEKYTNSYSVDVVSIDNHLIDILDKINFIKIDIQGFEHEAIKGMNNLLLKNKEIKLLTEFWPYGLKQSGSSALQYFNYLIDLKFNIFLLEKNTLLKLDEKKVVELNDLPLNYYFNILVIRDV